MDDQTEDDIGSAPIGDGALDRDRPRGEPDVEPAFPSPRRDTASRRTPRKPRASPEDRARAEHALLERLRTSRDWIGTTALCRHLEHTTGWGAYGSDASRLRTVQHWLKALNRLSVGERGFEHRETPRGYEYRRYGRERPPLASACLALLAQRLLEPLLPTDYVESDLRSHFDAARERVAENEHTLGRNGHAVGQLVERIAVAPRGQRLVREQPSYAVAAAVTDAILRRRRLEATYNGRDRRLHPYGLIFRDPKFYLLAAEEADLLAGPDPVLKLFVCSRFERLGVSDAANLVPDDFAVASWIAARGLDVPMQRVEAPRDRGFELVLRVHAAAGNLLRDLADFPLDAGQTIRPEPGGTSSLLRAPGQRATEALLEWILGRAELVEVVEPAFLRAAVGARIESMAVRYREPAAEDVRGATRSGDGPAGGSSR